MKSLCGGILLVLFIGLFPSSIFGQINFERAYGGSNFDGGRSVWQTTDGGYVIAGYTYSFGAGLIDVYLIKTDSIGDTLWTRTYGGESNDYGWSVKQTTDGGYIIAGYTRSFGAGGYDVYLIKTNASGETLWTKTYGGNRNEEGRSVQQTTDGGYVITGYTYSFGADSTNVYLIKTDSSGDTLWTKTYGGNRNEEGTSVQQTTDGGYVIAGSTRSFGAGADDVYLIKTDSSGVALWTRTYGSNYLDKGYSVQQTTDGGYVITGYSADSWDVYLIKTDSSGDTLWTRTYGGNYLDEGYSVQQTTDGGYIVAGCSSYSLGGLLHVYLIKTDSSGDSLWARAYEGQDWDDYGWSVQQTTDGGYVIVGYTGSFGAYGDVYLIKTDPDGYVGISDDKPFSVEFPRSWALSQNYPNPFNPSTTIVFDVPGTVGVNQSINLTIYDLRGRRVKELVNSDLAPGAHMIHWNGRNDGGELVTSGIYLYRLRADDETYMRKMTLVK